VLPISYLSHLAPKISKSGSIASLTEQGLRVNKTLLLGNRIKIHFLPAHGGSHGKEIMCDSEIVNNLNKLEFAVDGEVHFTFEDVLSMLPRSWFENKSGHIWLASYIALFMLLMQLVILVLAISRFKYLLSKKSTEPGDYNMCCKVPDDSEWYKAMIKTINKMKISASWC